MVDDTLGGTSASPSPATAVALPALDLTGLEALARDATPGKWGAWIGHEDIYTNVEGNSSRSCSHGNDDGSSMQIRVDPSDYQAPDNYGGDEESWCEAQAATDREYVVAAQPQTMLALIAYIRKLERMAMDDEEGHRCNSCERVFTEDEGEYGEDCWLCASCATEARAEGLAADDATVVAAQSAQPTEPTKEPDGAS